MNSSTTAPKDPGIAFNNLYKIVVRLRSKDGCPWDKEQSPSSIRSHLIEEAYELVEAINEKDANHISEEIGDQFLLATMVAFMHEEQGEFSVAAALQGICDKLIRRHPHVFGSSKVKNSDEVMTQWQHIKENVEGRRKKDSILDSVSKALPPLERAYQLQKKATTIGFDWKNTDDVRLKVMEELQEVADTFSCQSSTTECEEELGDLLFAIVNLARHCKVDPALALHAANEKFSKRFHYVEQKASSINVKDDQAKHQLEDAWLAAKSAERT